MRWFRRSRPDTAPLRRIGLDNRLSDEHLDVLALHTDVLRVPAGDVLARVGEVARQFIAIVDGSVEITDPFGRCVVSGPGTHVGATELATGEPHAATVTTRSEATLVVIFGPAFASATSSSAVSFDRRPHGRKASARSVRVHHRPVHSAHTALPVLAD